MPGKKRTYQVTLQLTAGDAPMVELGKMLGQTGDERAVTFFRELLGK